MCKSFQNDYRLSGYFKVKSDLPGFFTRRGTHSKLDFNELGNIFYNSSEAKYYNSLSNSLILNNTNPEENLILYMNFKSHNILNTEKREELYSIIDKYNHNIICL